MRHSAAIEELWASDGDYLIKRVDGQFVAVQQIQRVVVWSWLVVATFKEQRQIYRLTLLPDSLSANAHRLSRVYFNLYSFPQLMPKPMPRWQRIFSGWH